MRTFEGGVSMSRGQEMKKDSEEAEKIRVFIESEGVTSGQVREAYYRLVGVWEGEADPEPAVAKLQGLMESSGLPLSRFADLVKLLDQHEGALDRLPALIDGLQVTPHEKDVLRSIISKWPLGALRLYDADTGNLLSETVIPKMPLEDAARFRRDIATNLYGHFMGCKGRKIEVQFIEE